MPASRTRRARIRAACAALVAGLLGSITACGGGSGGGSGGAGGSIPDTLSVSAGLSRLTIHPGDVNVALPVTVGSRAGSDPVVVTLDGLPPGISAAPLTLAAGESGTLLLSASVDADQAQFPFDVPSGATAQDTAVSVVATAGALHGAAALTLTTSISNEAFVPAAGDVDLPVVRIDTDGMPIADKTTEVPGTLTITSADGATRVLPSLGSPDATATFHLHGNSTLALPKKPYHVKLDTSVDLLSLMGLHCPYVTSSGKSVCDKSKSYILLANYTDKTLLRDWAASALANAIPMGGPFLSPSAAAPTPSGDGRPMSWAPHSLFVELFVNGAYQGNYQLIEQVKIDSHRVDITELSQADTSGDLSGGYLLQIGDRSTDGGIFATPSGLRVGIVDPDFSPDPAVAAQKAWISGYVADAENALFGPDFADPALGWRAFIDETAAVNFYIVNDLLGNADGGVFSSSDYLYKPRGDPLLYLGPVWDFDVSSGNIDSLAIVDPSVPWAATAAWYARLFQDAGFKADVARQWNALKSRGVLAAWVASIDAQAAALQRSQANNAGRWPMQGLKVWPNAQAAGSYAGEVAYLQDWIALRTGYLDSQFNTKAGSATVLAAPSAALRAGVAATLSAQVSGAGGPTGRVFFLADGVVLGSAPLAANGQAQLTTAALPAGALALRAVYAGDDANALSRSPAVAATVQAVAASGTGSSKRAP